MLRSHISSIFPLVASMIIVNSPAMTCTNLGKFALSIAIVMAPLVHAKEIQVSPPTKKPAPQVPFTLDQVIAPRVKKMALPEMRPNLTGVKIAISSPSEKAREHVKQGFALVHAQWDFEAYRHFCAALVEDPECLMAYSGISLALAKPFSEYAKYRRAAVNRMQDLMEADDRLVKAGKVGRFTMMEKKFSYAVATLVAVSPRDAGLMFLKLGFRFRIVS